MTQRVGRAERRRRQAQAAQEERAVAATDHAEFVASLPERIAELRSEQTRALAELETLLRTVDPLELMAVVAFTYGADDAQSSPAYREYLLGAVATVSNPGSGEPSMKDAALAYSLAESIVNDTGMLAVFEGAAKAERDALDRLAFTQRAQTLWMRGDSYESHESSLIRRVFQPHDPWLVSHSLPSTDEFLAAVSEIYRRQVDQQLDVFRQLAAVPDRVSPRAMLRALDVTSACADASLARMLVTDVAGRSAPIAHGPLGSELSGKPLIRRNGAIYCFDRRLLAGARRIALEDEIFTDKKYYEKTFSKKRGQVAEEMTAEAFSKLLPGARILRGLYYNADSADGQRKRCELDILVHYDTACSSSK